MPQLRSLFLLLACLLSTPVAGAAQVRYYAGAMGGITTLKADGRSVITPDLSQISLYKPENGPTATVFGGAHLNNYLSLEASYTWNRNRLALTSTRQSSEAFDYYEQHRESSEHGVAGEVLLYFRGQDSFVRPYLSAGVGLIHLTSGDSRISSTEGTLPAPGALSSTDVALRVNVGIDVTIHDGWAFRFSFRETIRHNPVSAAMTPPGERDLAQFQNLFGFVKTF